MMCYSLNSNNSRIYYYIYLMYISKATKNRKYSTSLPFLGLTLPAIAVTDLFAFDFVTHGIPHIPLLDSRSVFQCMYTKGYLSLNLNLHTRGTLSSNFSIAIWVPSSHSKRVNVLCHPGQEPYTLHSVHHQCTTAHNVDSVVWCFGQQRQHGSLSTQDLREEETLPDSNRGYNEPVRGLHYTYTIKRI